MNTRLVVVLVASFALISFSNVAQAEEFEGPFIGAAAGYSRNEIDPNLADDLALANGLDQDAAHFQLFAGYDYAVAPKVRLGVEVAFGLGTDDELRGADTTGSIELDPEYTFEVAGRAGYLVNDNALLYVRGGYQNSRIEATLTEVGQFTLRNKDNTDGWLAGGGLEYAFGNNLRSRIEYRYSDLGNDGAEWDRHQVLAGVLWNFQDSGRGSPHGRPRTIRRQAGVCPWTC